MAELLLELFSEEIPARMQSRAADDLRRLVTEAVGKASLDFDGAKSFVTPRRLTLVVDGLPERQPDVTEEKRGPRADAPEKAIEGFLRANGLTREQCEQRETDRGVFLFAVVETEGQATADVIGGLVAQSIDRLGWAKSMRWGSGTMRWVRPLQRVLCLLDGARVAVQLPDGIPCDATTSGHRFHAPDVFEVESFLDYRQKLRDAHVILDAEERRRYIVEHASALAEADGLRLQHDPGLLEEVAGLVEWPVPLIGSIDDAFMEIPPEVLTTSMRTHQRYFSLLDDQGKLAPRFIVVANLDAAGGGTAVVAGNERVLRARLADAKFFWDQDRKRPLESRVPALREIIFHAKLGSLAEKVARIQALAAELVPYIPGADLDRVRSAATLAKADLTTEMVGEFPELQGTMGRYYALGEGENAEVAQAVEEHYAPQGPNDSCPTAPTSVAVALADKLDTLVGFFSIDEKPTGSRDPFALRRAALGIIRIIVENGLRLPLREALRHAYRGYSESVKSFEAALPEGHQPDVVERELMEFVADRLKVHLREEGVRHDLINAVFALDGEDDIVRLLDRVAALDKFVVSDDGANLLQAHKRASNIVAIEEKKDSIAYDGPADEAILAEPQEKTLHSSLAATTTVSAALLEREDFDGAMAELAKLRLPVDAFFDHVLVNCDDASLRANRLRLLSQIGRTMGGIADFSQIEG